PTSTSEVTSANYIIATYTPVSSILSSGSEVSADFVLSNAPLNLPTTPGTYIGGGIWAIYSTPYGGSPTEVEIATINLKEG
ncbi:MAG: hypothetical protein QW814_01705, partial [Methanothrix sp.]